MKTKMSSVLYMYDSGDVELCFYLKDFKIAVQYNIYSNGATAWVTRSIKEKWLKLPYLVECPLTRYCLSEEEQFQLSVVWDYSFPMSLLVQIQKYCYSVMQDNFLTHQNTRDWTIDLEFEYENY